MLKLSLAEMEERQAKRKKDRQQIIILRIKLGEDILCANCNDDYRQKKSFYELNNGDYVCGKECYMQYTTSYFSIKTIKGRNLL